jgi:flagellar hook-basal body complex protein FliE
MLDPVQGLSSSLLKNFSNTPGVDAQALKDIQSTQNPGETDFSKAFKAFGVPEAPNVDAMQKATEAAQLQLQGMIDRTPIRIGGGGPKFEDVIGSVVNYVDGKHKIAESSARDLFIGKSDNVHGAMIAREEAKIAFSLLVEVRNTAVESIQELMRINVG